jgi:dipeptidyl aminopeptidase/acylaminoacyl peptidase
MERDLRQTPLYQEIEAYYRSVLGPGFGSPLSPSEPAPSPDGRQVAFTAEVLEKLEGRPSHRLCLGEVDGGFRQITFGPSDDRSPAWSPDGRRLTFLSDRPEKGKPQLCQLHLDRLGEAEILTRMNGIVEYHAWSPDGSRILLGVAGAAAEQADAMGSGTVGEGEETDAPAWLPEVRTGEEASEERRRLHIYDVATGQHAPLGREELNVWEATWCGETQIAALVSEGAEEGAWYDAHVVVFDVGQGTERDLHASDVQLSYLEGSPDGTTLALIDARCSDRYLAAGELVLVDVNTGAARSVDAAGADVTRARWTVDGRLLASAIRGFASVVLDVDPASGTASERWISDEAGGDFYPAVVPLPDGRFVTTLSSAHRPKALLTIGDDGEETAIAALTHEGLDVISSAIDRVERVAWAAPDGLEIEGLVHLPRGDGPFPLLLRVHGGPIWAYQDRWEGPSLAKLLERGYSVFSPNPRGSTGRGRAFADAVVGDMGGADSQDYLSGIDHLVALGIADPERLGVYGGSYGGFMAAWLPAIDDRFVAAVSFSPVTDWVSQHFTSSLAAWDATFVGGSPTEPSNFGRFSPVMRFGRLRTPTLLTAGANDRATPPGQAIEFWQALRLSGVPSEVVIYPQEGHGVSTFPALIDFVARMVGWFDRFLPAEGAPKRDDEGVGSHHADA